MKKTMIPSIGRTVHYILPDGPNAGEHRPAVIVKVLDAKPTPKSACQLQVFHDGDGSMSNDRAQNVTWRQNVPQGTEPGTWHEAEQVAQPTAASRKTTCKK